ncbi:MAG: tetratricopeptide repeat protein, partial [Anaerolineales bacterium]|nr:tetratricopeptide repeat protein [Anaerolineales bacterium]
WDAAIAWYEQARQVFTDLKQPANVALVTRNIGDVQRQAKRYADAEATYRQACDIYRQLKNNQELSQTLFALGNLFRLQNQFDIAQEEYRQAVQIYTRNWDASLALAWLQLDTQPKLAEQSCQLALKQGEPVHKILAHIGLAALALGQHDQRHARAEFKKARALLATARAVHTVFESQLAALDIVVRALEAPEQALSAAQAFDTSTVHSDERDLIDISFGYLSTLIKRLNNYT